MINIQCKLTVSNFAKFFGRNHNETNTIFVGVFIDEFLTWENHTNHINSNISRAIFMIKQVKNLLPTESLKTL